MKKFKFLDWKVYKDSQLLFKEIYKIVNKLPRQYRFEFGSQLLRSALSIILNIAEGSGKESDKELSRYIEITFGSSYETLACLDTLRRNDLLNDSEFQKLKNDISNICSQLGGLKRKINSKIF